MKKYLFVLGLFLIGCEQIVELEIEQEEEKLVLQATFDNHYNPAVSVYIVGGQYGFNRFLTPGDNATVEVFEDNKSLGIMEYTNRGSNFSFYTLPNPFIPQVGKNYEVKVRHNDFAEISGSGTIPNPISITAELTGNTRKMTNRWDGEPSEAYEVRLSFSDPSDQTNYYNLIIDSEEDDLSGETRTSEPFYVYSSDILFTENNSFWGMENRDGLTRIYRSGYFFQDQSFNGKQKEIIMYVDIPRLEKPIEKIYFKLQHITEESFKYKRTRRIASQNDGNPFVQPTIIYNNIKGGGIGFFNTINVSQDSIQAPKRSN